MASFQSILLRKFPANTEQLDWDRILVADLVVQALDAQHPDNIFLVPLNSKYNVKQIAELLEWISKKPFQSEQKLVVITEAQEMPAEPQNKLLKIIEEPPVNTQIVLITNSLNKMLDTILSRCLFIDIASDYTSNLENDPLIEEFLNAKNLLERYKIVEKISKAENTWAIGSRILELIINDYLAGKHAQIEHAQIRKLTKLHSLNTTNTRLTLETLSLMLEVE